MIFAVNDLMQEQNTETGCSGIFGVKFFTKLCKTRRKNQKTTHDTYLYVNIKRLFKQEC